MPYLVTKFFPGGTEAQYRNVLAAVSDIPEPQLHHAAGETDDGFLLTAIFESKADSDSWGKKAMAKQPIAGGFETMPEEHEAEISNLET